MGGDNVEENFRIGSSDVQQQQAAAAAAANDYNYSAVDHNGGIMKKDHVMMNNETDIGGDLRHKTQIANHAPNFPPQQQQKAQNNETPNNNNNKNSSNANRKSSCQIRMNETLSTIPAQICRGKFTVMKNYVLGSGTYGDTIIVSGPDHQKYAAKFEKARLHRRAVLYYDQQFLYYLSNKSQNKYVPEFIAYGQECNYAFLVMELLGPSISEIFKHSLPQGLSTQTLVYICVGMVQCLVSLHKSDVIHRDIKPDNFAFGSLRQPRTIFIFDFGLSKQFKAFGKHIPMRSGKVLTGTARYVSIQTHRGLEQSRRDDLESCSYVMIFFFRKAFLPWMGLKHLTRTQHFREIARIKTELPLQSLCEGCPKQLAIFVQYCRKLSFEMEPNYNYLIQLLYEIIKPMNAVDLEQTVFEWETDNKLYKSLEKNFYQISSEFNSPKI